MRHRHAYRLTSWLRGLVLAGAAAILCWRLTVLTGTLAAIFGALAGALLADHLEYPERRRQGARLRLSTVLLATFAAAAAGLGLARWLAASSWIAGALGPLTTLHASEGLRWLALAGPGVFALRVLARRRPILELLEALVVGLALVSGFAAHRGGMVHRPLSIGDWAWSQGIDPALVFLVLGGLATLLLSSLLVSEERRRRLPLHFSSLVLVALVLLLVIRVSGLPKPQPSGELGLTGDPEEQSEGEGEGGGQGEDGEPDDEMRDLDFRDDYGSNGEQAPVAVVVLHDDYSPPAGVYYFRQTAFSQYNGHKLVQAQRRDVDRDVLRHFPTETLDVPSAPPAEGGRRPLRTSMGLLIDHVRPFALDSPARIRSIENPNPLHFRRAFEVRSHVQTLPYRELLGRRPGNADWTQEQWDLYLESPSDPRYGELAAALQTTLRDEYRSDPLGQALSIKSYLDKEGIYSRRSTHAGADDPAASFLFGDLTGYCVHFAHAATYLLRAMGVPARVAAGYAVAEESRGTSSSVMIRGGDAHAWPEIYLEDVGWVVVDLSPERTLDEPNANADPDLQRMLGEMMRQQMWSEDDLDDDLRHALDLGKIGRFLALVLLALLAAAYLVKIYRSQVPRFAPAGHLHRLGYRAALDRLADVGWRRRYGESRESFAARARELSPAFARLTEQHVGAALGSRRIAAADNLRRLLGRTRSDLRDKVPAWRRVLGALNPISWIFVK